MMFFLLILTVLILLFYNTFVKPMGYWKSKRVKEGNPIWIFGNFFDVVFNSKCANDVIYPLYNKYKKERYFGVHHYNKPILVVKDVALIKNICVKDFEHFLDHRSLVPDDIDPMFSKNLFALKGKRWRYIRRILSPAFTTSKLKGMLEIMDEHANDAVNIYLDKYQGVIEIELYDMFSRYCNDIVMNTAFGIKVDSFRNPDNEFYQMTNALGDFSGLGWILQFLTLLIAPRIYKLLNIPIFKNNVVNFYENLITKSINARESQGIVRNDLIQLFMAANKRSSINTTLDGAQKKQEEDIDADSSDELAMAEMLAQCSAFVVGGVDSVANLMCITSYELALNPDIQEKLRDEITNTLLEYDGKITYEGLLKMEYLDAVVNEASRLWPGDFILDRICTKPYTIQPDHPDEAPVQLEPGDVVWFPLYAIQRDPKYFQDPERFDPERFLSENKANINPYTYFPFGLGPRICIGVKFSMLECKVFICHLLKHFKIVPVPKSQIPLQFIGHVFQYDFKDGFWFGLKSLKE